MRAEAGTGSGSAVPRSPDRSGTAPGDRQAETAATSPRRWAAFVVVSAALLMASIDATIVSTALASMQRELHTTLSWTGWTITVYSLGQIVALPLGGRISDQYGRRRIFLLAAVLFTAASLACSLAGNVYLLVVFRAVQALGGGMFMPSATGVVADAFGPDRDRAIGMFTSILPVGGIVGPVFGGLIVSAWSWREIFLVNVPIGLLILVLGAKLIPHSPRRAATRPDVPGILLLAGTLLSAMFAIAVLGTAGTRPWDVRVLGTVVLAVALGVAFVRHAHRAPAPFIPMRLLRGRGFGLMNALNFVHGGATIGFGALVPTYAQYRFGVPVLQAGTLLAARGLGTIAVAALAVFAMRRTGVRPPMMAGFAVMAAGMIALAFEPAAVPPYAWLVVTTAVTGIGMGMSIPASNNAGLSLAPDQVAAIAGLRGMFRQSGSIVAVAVTTAILTRSATPGVTQAYVFMAFGVLLLLVVPFIRLVPERRGRW